MSINLCSISLAFRCEFDSLLSHVYNIQRRCHKLRSVEEANTQHSTHSGWDFEIFPVDETLWTLCEKCKLNEHFLLRFSDSRLQFSTRNYSSFLSQLILFSFFAALSRARLVDVSWKCKCKANSHERVVGDSNHWICKSQRKFIKQSICKAKKIEVLSRDVSCVSASAERIQNQQMNGMKVLSRRCLHSSGLCYCVDSPIWIAARELLTDIDTKKKSLISR